MNKKSTTHTNKLFIAKQIEKNRHLQIPYYHLHYLLHQLFSLFSFWISSSKRLKCHPMMFKKDRSPINPISMAKNQKQIAILRGPHNLCHLWQTPVFRTEDFACIEGHIYGGIMTPSHWRKRELPRDVSARFSTKKSVLDSFFPPLITKCFIRRSGALVFAQPPGAGLNWSCGRLFLSNPRISSSANCGGDTQPSRPLNNL